MTVNVRGANYRNAMEKYTPLLIQKVKEKIEKSPGLTAIDIGRMAIDLDLPMKTAFDFLGYVGVIPKYTWETKGYTAKAIKEAIEKDDQEAIAQ